MIRCLAVLSVFVLVPRAAAVDWPEFRGPTGQGHSAATGLPVEWSPTENVRWKVEVPGKGWSSPVVSGGRIYLTTAVPENGDDDRADQSLRALCLDAATGGLLWERALFEIGSESIADNFHQKNSHASPTPIVEDGMVYVHFGPHGTACLTRDGQAVWRTRALEYAPRHGSGGSPALADDVLVINCDGLDVQFVAALDRRTGDVRWKKDRPTSGTSSRFSFCTPLVIDAAGRRQVISPASDKVVAYDPRDGSELWQVRYVGYSIVPRPVYAHGLVYISTSFDSPMVLAIDPTGTGDVTETHVKWDSGEAAPSTPSMLAVGDDLYFISDRGIASCVDARTGDVHWKQRVGGNFSASPLYADGRIYFQSEEGEGIVIEAGRQYVELARNDLGERSLASYGVVDSDLLIRTERHLYRLQGTH